MTARGKKGNLGKPNLRKAFDPYTIHLGNGDYILDEETLARNVDTKTAKAKGWYFPKLKFLSFKEGLLELLNTHAFTSYKLTINIEKDKLHVACACATNVEKLCVHSYRALQRMIWYEEWTYFQKFRPKGLIEMALTYKKHFNIEKSERGLKISPKAELGHVYQLSETNEPHLNAILNLPAPQISKTDKKIPETALSYIVAYSYRNKLLPSLLPCLGTLNKAGTAIKNFDQFIIGTQKQYDVLLTDSQRTLNKLSYELWRNVENLSGFIADTELENTTDKTEKLQQVFALWQQAMPLLQQQSFVFMYLLYGKRELKGKPKRQRLSISRLSVDVPALHFQLMNKGTFYQLELKVLVKGKEFKNVDLSIPFFIKYGASLYLLCSLRDAGLVEWIREAGGRITVFKEQYLQFEQVILKPLQKDYKVTVT